jgi:hypothetical protein
MIPLKHHFNSLPKKLVFTIFKFLSPRDQDAATCVCKKWKIILEDKCFKEIRDFCFGKTKWLKYFGDSGVEPPFPPNIGEILSRPCIFWPNKKVRDTHLLVLVPETVNGRAFHLDSLAELIQSPKSGHRTEYRYYNDDVKNELGTKRLGSHWVLMTREAIPESLRQTYEDQKALVQKHAQKSEIPYELPKALEVTTAILMHHVETGKRLYGDHPWIWTRCQEMVSHHQWPAAIGGFSSEGLAVFYGDWGGIYSGVCALRSF